MQADPKPTNETCVHGSNEDLLDEQLYSDSNIKCPTTLFTIMKE